MNLKIKLNTLLKGAFFKQAGLDTLYFTISQIGSKLISILVLPIIVAATSDIEFANYDVFLIVSNFIMLLVTAGTDSGIVVSVLDNQKKTDQVENSLNYSMLISSTIFIFLILLSIILSPIIKQHINLNLIYLSIIYAYLTSIQSNIASFLRWKNKSKQAAIISVIANSMGLLIGLIYATSNKTNFINHFITGLVIGAFVSCIFSLFISKDFIHSINLKKHSSKIKEFLSFSLPFLPASLLNNFISNLDRLIIYPLFDAKTFAAYAFCSRIIQIPRLGLTIIGSGVQPSLLKNYETEIGSKRIKQYYEAMLISVFVIIAISMVGSKLAFQMFNGLRFSEALVYFPILLGANLFSISIYFNGWGYSITKKTKYMAYIFCCFAIANFSLNYLLAKHFGLHAMLWGSLGLNAILSFVYTMISERLYSFQFNLKKIATYICSIIALLAIYYYSR